MTTSTDPDEIREDIERTRAALSNDVDRLADAANPKNVAKRQVDKMKDAAIGVKDKVMGVAEDASDTVVAAGQDGVAAVRETVVQAPAQVKAKARGNPLAAGLIAFGAGLLISSLFPATQKEQEAVAKLQENLGPAQAKAKEAVQEMAGNLQQPAQDALESVKQAATEAVDKVKSEGAAAADDMRDQAGQSKDHVTSA